MSETQTDGRGFLAWWNRTPLYQRILGALVLGLAVGTWLGYAGGWTPANSPKWVVDSLTTLKEVSDLVLRLLSALAPVIILVAIIRALVAVKLEQGSAGRLLFLLGLNTLVAIVIGLLVANIIRPGHWGKLDKSGAAAPVHTAHGVISQFLDNVPRSLLGPLGDNGKMIGVIFIALGFGLALRRVLPRHPEQRVGHYLELAFDTLITVLHWIIAVIPIGVFGVVASTVGTKGFGDFIALGVFIIAVLVALALQATYYLTRIRFGSWVRPWDLIRMTRDALVMAFSTASSTATMPVTYDRLRNKVGLRDRSASLGALVGSNFNNDGTALYEAMAALFVSQLTNANLGIEKQFILVLTSVLASVGAAGIPEAGLVTMTMVFHSVGLDPSWVPLLLPVDWFLDRCRTAINVMGDINVACMLDGKEPENV